MRKSKIEVILSKSEHCEPIYQDDIILNMYYTILLVMHAYYKKYLLHLT